MKRLPDTLLKEIETIAVYGDIDDDGKLIYRSIKQLAKDYDVSYETLRRRAGKGKWLKRRKAADTKVTQKIDKLKCDSTARQSVQSDEKFYDTFELARQVGEIKLEDHLKRLKEGKYVSGIEFFNTVRGVKESQDGVKTAQGEPSNISKIEGKLNIDERRESLKEKMHRIVTEIGSSNPRD